MELEVSDLSCGYAPQKPIVQHANMRIASGEVCALLGPNGVGKTTLFKTLLHLLPPLGGRILIDGADTRNWEPRRTARIMAYVAQSHIPTEPYRVRDIAMMGRMGQIGLFGQPSRRDHEIVEQALEDVGIRHLRDAAYTEISGGERQLLMIARALAQQPKLLVMDEPTANLDYGNAVLVMQCIRTLAEKGLCVIFTTHQPDQAFQCGAKTAFLFRDGPMCFGTADQVITEQNLRRAYHADIRVLEVLDADGHPLKITTPRFMRAQNEMR